MIWSLKCLNQGDPPNIFISTVLSDSHGGQNLSSPPPPWHRHCDRHYPVAAMLCELRATCPLKFDTLILTSLRYLPKYYNFFTTPVTHGGLISGLVLVESPCSRTCYTERQPIIYQRQYFCVVLSTKKGFIKSIGSLRSQNSLAIKQGILAGQNQIGSTTVRWWTRSPYVYHHESAVGFSKN